MLAGLFQGDFVTDIRAELFSEVLRQIRTRSSMLSFGSRIDKDTGEPVALLNPITVAGAGTYKRAFSCHFTVVVKLAEVHFESAQ